MGGLYVDSTGRSPATWSRTLGAMPIVSLANLEQFAAVNLLSDGGHIRGPLVVPQAAQITINFALIDGKVAHMVLYGRYAGTFAGTPAQATSILVALAQGTPWSTLVPFLATATNMNGVTIRNVNVADQPLISSSAGNNPGTSSGTALPSEVSAVITFRTAKAGRSGRGRGFFPGWATTALGTNDVITASAVTALGTWASTNIPAAFSGQGYTHVLGLPHRQAYTSPNGTPHADRPATTETITGWVCRDNHWDTMRRRGLK